MFEARELRAGVARGICARDLRNLNSSYQTTHTRSTGRVVKKAIKSLFDHMCPSTSRHGLYASPHRPLD